MAPAGQRYGRIYASHHLDPLGYGKSASRFSDPRRRRPENRFGVLYLGETLTVCFLETVLRDRRDGVVGNVILAERELETLVYAEVELFAELRLADLRENGAIAMGVPSDTYRGSQHGSGRQWSLAIHEHSQRPDGIAYPSRLNGHTNIALYDRGIQKIQVIRARRLIDVPELAGLLDEFQIALID